MLAPFRRRRRTTATTTSWAVTAMNDFTDVLETIAQNARRGHERAGDYRGEDGLLY